MLPDFDLVRAKTVDDAIGLLAEGAIPYAGGTELLLAMKVGLVRPTTLVDLKRVPELGAVRVESDQLVVGGTATHAAVATHLEAAGRVPVLAEVEGRVGNVRVRTQGTIGGNLCFAEPKSDVATVLMALGADVVLSSRRGVRTVPVRDFVRGPYWTVREDDELLTEVRIPARSPATCVYLKFQTRERPTVGVALAGELGGGLTLAIGAVTAQPVFWDFDQLEAIDADAVAGEIEPMPGLDGSVDYKRHVTAVFIRHACEEFERRGDAAHS